MAKYTKYYVIGGYKFKLDELETGYFKLTTKDGDLITYNLFQNLDQAFKEIASYSEVEEEDWED